MSDYPLRDELLQTLLSEWRHRYYKQITSSPTDHCASMVDAIRPIVEHAIAQARAETAIDATHIEHQREWSTRTFGPGLRLGVIDHIRKELIEVEANPTDLEEWVDVIILGFDGAWRAGHEPQQIIDAIKAKQARNEARTWPDWRTADRDKAIEHDRQHAEGGGQP